MSTATQRKAWNEAMRSAGAVIPATGAGTGGAFSGSGSGGAASSYYQRGGVAARASDRRRKRRNNARKSSVYGGGADGGSGGAASLQEEREYRVAIHMDMLEGVVDNSALDGDDDDEYDEFAELLDNNSDDDNDDADEGGKSSSKSKSKRKRKRGKGSSTGAAGANKKAANAVPKYLKSRSLASILIEEASRGADSMARQYVDASVRSGRSTTTARENNDTMNNNNAIQSTTKTITTTNPYPSRKFCPVTGLLGEYIEPKSGIPYASLSALEQIRERPPPWMNLGSAGSASYWEAMKSLQNDA